ncbi:MAG TPA: DegV family protein [Solirubrobacteraceae bacterium]|nr:DegV family protein [Solirubrobacteraceae bacterium]
MAGVAVVVDTTHYLPRPLVDELGLHEVSLYVNWKGGTDRERDLPDFDGFYAHLTTASDLPTTSQPSVGDFLEVYEPLLEAGHDIVSIHLSGQISGTVQSAEQAQATLVERGVAPERVAVVDSRTGCGAMGFLAIAAANVARRGGSAAEAAAAAVRVREGLRIWFAVDTLEFLRRGGRIGAARALLGATLKIKPILTLEEEITPVERVRTAGRAEARLVDYLRERRAGGCDEFGIQHVRDPERAARLADAGREIFGREPVFVSEIGPVIGTHVGPGLLGVSGTRSDLLDPR